MRSSLSKSISIWSGLWLRFRTFALYILIGLFALGIDLGLFWVFVTTITMTAVVANIASMAIGMVVSFGLNAVANFKTTDKLLHRFASYTLIILIGTLVSSGMIWYMTTIHVIDSVTAKLLTLPVILGLQFSLNRRLTFRPAATKQPTQPRVNATEGSQ